jgi:hypothetical protein
MSVAAQTPTGELSIFSFANLEMTDTNPTDDNMIGGNLDWTSDIENMLAKWCDQAKCFEWMHNQAFSIFDYRARVIVITSNVLTAIGGISNVIVGGSSPDGFNWSIVFGSMSIVISIANMLQEKLAYNTRAAKHEQYSIQWGVIRRKIEEEIMIPPNSRKDCKTFLKYLRQDINLVSMDGNAMIPEFIKERCAEKFKSVPDFDIPDICGHVEHTKVYVRSESAMNRPLLTDQ